MTTMASWLTRATAVGALLTTWAVAQCQIGAQVEIGIGGVDREVLTSVMWDPDGAGPAGAQLVLGGRFTIAGDIDANHVVICDPVTEQWSPLGTGLDGDVMALAVSPSGELYAGGNFVTAGGTPLQALARWNGFQWQPVASFTGSPAYYVESMTFLPNGDLIVGGGGTQFGTLPGRLARWDGFSWSWLGGDANDTVHALRTLSSGELVAGGWFTSIGGTAAAHVASWNGNTWSPLAAGFNGPVYSLSPTSGGELFAAGSFSVSGVTAMNRVAHWNGAAWQALGSGCDDEVQACTLLANGDLVVVGDFSVAGGQAAKGIARWNGATWSGMGTGTWSIVQFGRSVIAMPNGDVVVGKYIGAYWNAGPGQCVLRWTGTGWRSMGNGIDAPVARVLKLPNGDDLVLGSFSRIGGVAAPFCARRGSTGWSTLGSGLDRPAASALLTTGGDLVVGGSFTTAGGVPAGGLARWDGVAWLALATTLTGTNSSVNALAFLPNGDLLAAGVFTSIDGVAAKNIARWNGSAWQALGSGLQGGSGYVSCLLVLPNGDVVAGGNFTVAGGTSVQSIARWDGSTWSSIGTFGSTTQLVASLELLPNGDILATGGLFVPPNNSRNLARWNGTAWQPLAGGLVSVQWDAFVLPDGDLLATSTSTGGSNLRLQRFDGVAWSPLTAMPDAELLNATTDADGSVLAAVTRHRGPGLGFSLVRLATTCPATATPFGTVCAGSAGAVTLTASTPPWTGSTMRTVATGFAANSIGLLAAGVVTTNVPLASIVPQGLPGCALSVQPVVIVTVLPSGGAATAALSVPDSMALVGFVMHQQMIVAEFGSGGTLSAFTGSNGLTLTVGTF